MINKKKLKDFNIEKSSALKKLESYSVDAYDDFEDEDTDDFQKPSDYKVFKGNEKALKNKIQTQVKKDAKTASINNFKKEEVGKAQAYSTVDDVEYDEVADEWQDINEFSSPLDFNYANSSVKGARKATQPVNSVFIGTAMKQIQESQKNSTKQLDQLQKQIDAKLTAQKKQYIPHAQLESKDTIRNAKAMGWAFFGKDYSSMTDYAVGIDYINKFHAYNKTSALQYVNGLYSSLGNAKTISQIEGLGRAIKTSGTAMFSSDLVPMSEGDVDASAKTLASLASGRVPASVGAWFYALQGQATQTPFTDAVLNNPIVQATQKVGDTIIKAGETVVDLADSTVDSVGFISKINKFLPFVIPVAVGYVALKYFGGVEGIVKSMKKQNPSKKRRR